jgi:hypothetical protein
MKRSREESFTSGQGGITEAKHLCWPRPGSHEDLGGLHVHDDSGAFD